MNTRPLFIAVISAALLFLPALLTFAEDEAPSGMPPMPPARSVPGVNAPDDFPGGCVDCHVVRKDIGRDVRISTILKSWADGVEPERFLEKAQKAAPEGVTLKGKHPDVEWAFSDIPNSCLTCHAIDSTSLPPLCNMMHLFHLTGGEENPFMTMFQAQCTYCHKLNKDTGLWTLRSGPEHPQ